ncbi:STAS domain-containing protein [Actinomadura parmotrematis]|uniref:Anti-sigma factor antagonist n=1 Tax=Actinomadura parmotrematis TaxID=2864039 RepID=A0ABS7G250_9ACTN|nr:STAS domain-containing protein [Actinomadura parmotrematis]MBW8485907.1 STAS domain-containing protein [Actinomadura parmotrematis]
MHPGSIAEDRVTMTVRHLPDHTIIALSGELDLASTAALREKMLVALNRAGAPVVIDLSAVTFCDAAGLALLVGIRRRARGSRLGLTLAAPRPPVRKLLRITGLDRAFTVHESLAQARGALDRPTLL